MSSIPTNPFCPSRSTSGAGLTFIENSDLSVCEKIKLYFAKNQNPAYETLNSSSSSTSSSSADFDGSFQKILEKSKQRKEISGMNNRTRRDASEILLMDESTVDLCSPDESAANSPLAAGRVEASPNLSAFNGTLFGDKTSRQRASIRRVGTGPDGEDSDDSLGVAELDESLSREIDEDSAPWYLEQSASDISFLEHERECAEEAKRESSTTLDFGMEINETQLFDVEAPSMLWDQTISNDTHHMIPLTTTTFRNRPSTIPEESTINSSSNSSQSKSQPASRETSLIINHSANSSHFKNPPVERESSLTSILEVTKPCRESSMIVNSSDNLSESSKSREVATSKTSYRESSYNVFPKKTTTRTMFLSSDSPSKESNMTSSSNLAQSTSQPALRESSLIINSSANSSQFKIPPEVRESSLTSIQGVSKPSRESSKIVNSSENSSKSREEATFKTNYRESSYNVFPKKKTRTMFLSSDSPSKDEPPKPLPKRSGTNLSRSPLTTTNSSKPLAKPLTPNVLHKHHLAPKSNTNQSTVLHPKTQNMSKTLSTKSTFSSPAKPPRSVAPTKSPAANPKHVTLAAQRESFSLMSFDDTITTDENATFDEENTDDEDSLNHARQFNDTIEAMDFFMGEGKKILNSAVKKSPSKPAANSKVAAASPTSPVPMNFSPKTGRTPDTIRRRILMRNMLRNSAVADATTGSNAANAAPVHKFSQEEMMVRRSIRPMDDSFED